MLPHCVNLRLRCQVIPATVRSVPPDGTAEQPASTSQQLGSAPPEGSQEHRPVVQDGRITYWPGFEALLHYILYQQASG